MKIEVCELSKTARDELGLSFDRYDYSVLEVTFPRGDSGMSLEEKELRANLLFEDIMAELMGDPNTVKVVGGQQTSSRTSYALFTADGQIKTSTARCHPNDRSIKIIGMTIALCRLAGRTPPKWLME